MIDIFKLKAGNKIRYDIPDDFIGDEKIKQLSGKITEIVEIEHLLNPETLDTVIKPIVKDVATNEKRVISSVLYPYLTLIEE